MTDPLTIVGDTVLSGGVYDVDITLTTGVSKIQRSFDLGVTWKDITDASWSASTTASIGPIAEARYRSQHTGDGAITVRRVG